MCAEVVGKVGNGDGKVKSDWQEVKG